MQTSAPNNLGFTLIELVMIIVLLGIISVVAVAQWPTGLDEDAAVREMKQSLRYAQHLAMTRQFQGGATAWGVSLAANTYTLERQGGSTQAPQEFVNRYLLGKNSITLTGPATLLFNGLGEPIASDASPLGSPVTYTIAGSRQLSVCPQTGYVMAGGTCP